MHLPGANSRKVVVEVVTVLENLATVHLTVTRKSP